MHTRTGNTYGSPEQQSPVPPRQELPRDIEDDTNLSDGNTPHGVIRVNQDHHDSVSSSLTNLVSKDPRPLPNRKSAAASKDPRPLPSRKSAAASSRSLNLSEVEHHGTSRPHISMEGAVDQNTSAISVFNIAPDNSSMPTIGYSAENNSESSRVFHVDNDGFSHIRMRNKSLNGSNNAVSQISNSTSSRNRFAPLEGLKEPHNVNIAYANMMREIMSNMDNETRRKIEERAHRMARIPPGKETTTSNTRSNERKARSKRHRSRSKMTMNDNQSDIESWRASFIGYEPRSENRLPSVHRNSSDPENFHGELNNPRDYKRSSINSEHTITRHSRETLTGNEHNFLSGADILSTPCATVNSINTLPSTTWHGRNYIPESSLLKTITEKPETKDTTQQGNFSKSGVKIAWMSLNSGHCRLVNIFQTGKWSGKYLDLSLISSCYPALENVWNLSVFPGAFQDREVVGKQPRKCLGKKPKTVRESWYFPVIF
ncbi:hypothetical protein M422DRAFT_266677 [Sphaerobolus stellatus SS14]|uniref:Uncharacterized protein n=1 Tax=Sphaerobolus stellatus (strain SS14) TaxID=990650 RepID=A0A0C9UR57_SPHS4|nr:hypothetical protein M422DRAFT_266677 [Sphaerobolus stellatus SS14]